MANRRKILYTVEVAAALLYCGFIVRLILKEDPESYAKVLHGFARTCRFVAGHVGHVGIVAELEYAKIVELGRMN